MTWVVAWCKWLRCFPYLVSVMENDMGGHCMEVVTRNIVTCPLLARLPLSALLMEVYMGGRLGQGATRILLKTCVGGSRYADTGTG